MTYQPGDRVHFIGIGGIGVSAIARLFHSKGVRISGSDVALPPIESLPPGMYKEGHKESNIPEDATLVIYSPAAPETNPERVAAKKRGIRQCSYPEALALVTRAYNTIAISGTHGKTTTTALAGKLFIAGGNDPSVIVGGEIADWKDRNLYIGSSDIFIVEACEYRRHMLNLSPQAILLTNLELDHPDYYVDLNDIKSAFKEYIEKLSGDGLLIINNDDANLRDIAKGTDAIVVTYGIGDGHDLFARNVKQVGQTQSFELVWKNGALGEFVTPLPGLYNIYNILGAVALFLSYGGNSEVIRSVVEHYGGVGRRFEEVGLLNGRPIISDYAHHPTALRSLVEATMSRYPGKDILTVFRPHHKERARKLYDQFVTVLSHIPHTLLVEIYDVAGREENTPISSMDLIRSTLSVNPRSDIVYAKDLDEAETMIRNKVSEFDIILVVGAGDAHMLAKRLVEK
jgi:UDP-N-acetylmuramate--alanine ligase